MVAQAELWLMETPNQKRRPVLVVSRDEVIPVLNNVVVAPVTSTVRSIPTCIPVGTDQGIDHDSVATFDQLSGRSAKRSTRSRTVDPEPAFRRTFGESGKSVLSDVSASASAGDDQH